MITEKNALALLRVLMIATFLAFSLPTIEGRVVGENVSGTIGFLGFNLAEISILGIIMLIMHVAHIICLHINLPFKLRTHIAAALNIATCLFYLISCAFAEMYLEDMGAENITYGVGAFAVPLLLSIGFGLSLSFEPLHRPPKNFEEGKFTCEDFIERGEKLKELSEVGYALYINTISTALSYVQEISMNSICKKYDAETKKNENTLCKAYMENLNSVLNRYIFIDNFEKMFPGKDGKLIFAKYLAHMLVMEGCQRDAYISRN